MQSINLYLPEFRPKFNPLSAGFLVLVSALFFMLLTIIQLNFVMEKQSLSEQLTELKQELETTEQQLEKLKKVPKGMDKAQVEAAIATAKDAIRNREYALNRIKNDQLGNDKGFSSAFSALSRYALTDVVLTEFAFLQGGLQVELTGLTKRNSAVPEYIHQLQSDSFFRNSDFGSLMLKKSQKPGLMEFTYAKPEQSNPENTHTTPSVPNLLKGF